MADSTKRVRVTALDLETGDTSTVEVMDDYVLVCAGSAYVDSIQRCGNGTVHLTIKGAKR